MRKSIKATIFYMVDKRHPDIKYIGNPAEEQSFTDTYTFDLDRCGNLTTMDMKAYAANDLRLIAGGGYDTKHIHKVRFEFEEV